jgi:hypothetical protein
VILLVREICRNDWSLGSLGSLGSLDMVIRVSSREDH